MPACRPVLIVALLALAGMPAAPAWAGPDLEAIEAALSGEPDAGRRRALVPALVALGDEAAARVLQRLVRTDPDLSVRVEAARGLGRVRAEEASGLLLETIGTGGPRRVRDALHASLGRRKDAATALLAALSDRKTPPSARILLVHALGALRDAESLAEVARLVRSEDPALRGAALVALAARRDASDARRAVMVEVLSRARDTECALQALDALEPAVHEDLRAAISRHATSLDPPVREAAEHLLRLLGPATPDAPAPAPKESAPAEGEHRYAEPEGGEDPPGDDREPATRSRFDLVYALDVTGSAHATLPRLRTRVLDEMELLQRLGGSVRVGIVAYRGGRSPQERARSVSVLPPAFDPQRVRAFLESLDTGGVDDRGAAVAAGLAEALDRTPWRWNAMRIVQLFADSDVDDLPTASRTVAIHFRADGTRTRVAYVLRTRTRVPEGIEALAPLGGTGVVERIE